MGLDPTVLVGATAPELWQRRTAWVAARTWWSKPTSTAADFWRSTPRLALITGIEADHLDYFRDLEEIVTVFQAFAERVLPGGLVLTNADDPVLAATNLGGQRRTYGESGAAQWRLGGYAPKLGGGCDLEILSPLGSTDGFAAALAAGTMP